MATEAHPFHEGEVALQKQMGVHERIAKIGAKIIRDHMPEQHRFFFESLPYLALGTVDSNGDSWATFLTGSLGFASSPDETTLDIEASLTPEDPAANGFGKGASVGLLGIELSNRRRNRMNGTVSSFGGGIARVSVRHSFGNCPKYIQTRALQPTGRTPGSRTERTALSTTDRALIEEADTFFVSSYIDLKDERQVDVSHRGGNPGFVKVSPEGTLTIPDFSGNRAFNTLGNIRKNPRSGLSFIDWTSGHVLQMTGRSDILQGDTNLEFEGAERFWRFTPEMVVFREYAFPFCGRLIEPAPSTLRTGRW